MTLVDKDKQFELINAIKQNDMKQKPGGSAANTVIAVSQLGGSAFYSCKVANDAHGDFYINDMHNSGIDTNFLHQKPEDGITGKCMVMITDDADRTMNTFLGVTANLSTREVNEQAIKNAEYVYIEGYLISSDTAFKAMKQVIKLADKHDTKIALTLSDPSVVAAFKERFERLLDHPFDLLFCNEEEAKEFTNKNSLTDSFKALNESAKKFVVTKGAEGSVLFDGQQFIDIAPIEVKAVDTNGAGDMFAGTFLYGITNGMSFEEAGNLASRTSAQVVTQYGPRLTQDEINTLQAKN